MKITGIKAQPLAVYWADHFGGVDRVPEHLLRPSANFTAEDRPRLGQFSTLVVVETDQGVVGLGEAWGLPEPRVTAAIIEHLLAPHLVGKDPLAIDQLWESMFARPQDGFQRAFLLEAMSGVDIALWDIKGKSLGLPVYRLLGGPFREQIETYASPVPFLPPEEAANKAVEFVERGFRTIKIKVGAGLQIDLERTAAVRRAVGPDIQIVVDVNCGYNVPQAVQLGRRLAEYDVMWLEEPVPVEDRAGLAEVRQALDMAVVAGENEHTTKGVLELLQPRAVDAVQINILRVGGITGALRIARLAHCFGVPLAPHGVGAAVGLAAILHVLAAIPNFMIYEYNQLLNPMRDELLTEPPGFSDSCLHVPTGPGLGIEVAPEALERFSLK